MKTTMLISSLLFSINIFATTTNSVITLSGGGNVLPAASLSLSLNGLIPSVTYSVVCYIDTQYPFQYIRFGSNFASNTSTIVSSSLNGNYVIQDQLIVGHNIAVINGNFSNPAMDYLLFTNLDNTNSFNVNHCFGIPVSV